MSEVADGTLLPRLCGRYGGKVVIVTGGSSGIGYGCCSVFLSAGANVVFCSHVKEEGMDAERQLNTAQSRTATAATTSTKPEGGNLQQRKDGAPSDCRRGEAVFFHCDVTKGDQLQAMVEHTLERFGKIDCVINNAGAHPPHYEIEDFSVDDARRLFDLNFFAVFELCKIAKPHLKKTKGSIINISSLVGAQGQTNATTYGATKGAVTAFTKSLAIECARYGVRVNSVSPGNIWTPLWRSALPDDESEMKAGKAKAAKTQAMNRFGTPEEAGRLCLFIAAEATFTTGVDHLLTGGAELGYGYKVDLL